MLFPQDQKVLFEERKSLSHELNVLDQLFVLFEKLYLVESFKFFLGIKFKRCFRVLNVGIVRVLFLFLNCFVCKNGF